MKALVLCADDYAVHAPASQGIVQLARVGRISATSVMVLSPRWAADAAPLRELRGLIDVGLHLDWTSDFAVAAGHGVPLSAAMCRSLLGGFDVAQARRLIAQQLDAFEAQWQAPPDHIDGHQHVQQFAGIRQALVQLLRARYGQQQPYLRISQAPPALRSFKSRVIAAMGAHALRQDAAQAGISCAPSLSGVYDFQGGQTRYAKLMARWLAQTPSGIIMCHPASAVAPDDSIGAARQWEFDYLGSDEFVQVLAQQQVRLARGPG